MRALSLYLAILISTCFAGAVSGQSADRRATQIATATAFFTNALQQNPDDINALFNLASLYIEIDHLDSAEVLLEHAESLDGDDALIRTALGKVRIYKADAQNLQGTIRTLEKAVRLDSTLSEAKYLLAGAYISLVPGQRRFDDARQLLTSLETHSPGVYDVAYLQAVMMMQENRFIEAIVRFEALILEHRGHPGAQIRLGILYFKNGNTMQASQMFLLGLDRLTDRLEQTYIYYITRDLLSDRNMDTYQALPYKKRGPWLARFWRSQDPTPGTSANEFLEEFFRRRRYALIHYRTNQSLAGYDDRGRIYMKYGEPDDWYRSPSSTSFKANESWIYYSIDPYLHFDFVERGGMYVEEQDLRAAVPLRRASRGVVGIRDFFGEDIQSLYRERVDLGGIYMKVGMGQPDVAGIDSDLEMALNTDAMERERAVLAAPPNRFVHDYEMKPLNFIYNTGLFRGTAGRTRVEVYFGIPLKDLDFSRDAEGKLTTKLDVELIFQDRNYRPVKALKSQVDVAYMSPGSKGEHYINEITYELVPGFYQMAFSVKSFQSGRWGIYKDSLYVPSFSDKRLMLSSIQLSSQVDQPAVIDANQPKGGISVRPKPYPGFTYDDPPNIYFEIYNLEFQPNGLTHYRTEISVNQVNRKLDLRTMAARASQFVKTESTLLLTEEIEGTLRNDQRVLELDISALPLGQVVLSIKIEDLVTGQTTRQAHFFQIDKTTK